MLFVTLAHAASGCPATPLLRDPDGKVVALAQNLKFIITGERRAERSSVLREWLRQEGAHVDLLLLSEARQTGDFEAWAAEDAPEWCFWTQVSAGLEDGYAWAPIDRARPPGGLALGIRQRPSGALRTIAGQAGRPFRARPTSLAEGFLGRIAGWEKGWAGLEIDGTQLVWSHTQASYPRRPETGAGQVREGRAGQFEDLAEDLGRPAHPTLLTGDLNLLSGFTPAERASERLARARERDDRTIDWFREKTGIDLTLPWNELNGRGSYAGAIDRRKGPSWDTGATYDRVGVNDAFVARHPGTSVREVDIARGWLGLSDHLGLEIDIPFEP